MRSSIFCTPVRGDEVSGQRYCLTSVRRILLASWTSLALYTGCMANAQDVALPPDAPAPPSSAATSTDGSADRRDVITITASRRQTAIDRRSYDVSTNPDVATTTAADAIARLPGVITDIDGNISILGETNISYRVDGQYFPRDLALEIPAAQIERIEVVTNPGASERSQGIVLNLILRKELRNPQSLTVTAQADSRNRYKLSGNLVRETDKWKTFLMVNTQSDETRRTNTHDLAYLTGPEAGDIGRRADEFQNVNDHTLLLGFIQRKLPGDRALSVALTRSISPTEYDATADFERRRDGMIVEERAEQRRRQSDFVSDGVTLAYGFERPEDTLSISLNIGQNTGDSHTDQDFLIDGVVGRFDRFSESSGNSIYLISSREKKRDNGRNLKYGFDYQRRIIETFYSGTDSGSMDNPLIQGQFEWDQEKASLHGSTQFALGDWTVLPGLRVDHIRMAVTTDGVAAEDDPTFSGLLPSLHLSRQLGSFGQLKGSIASKVIEPNAAAFDSSLRQTGYRTFTQGDPDVDYGTQTNYELSHEASFGEHKILSTLYHRQSNDVARRVTEYLGEEDYLYRYLNVDEESRSGLNVNVKRTVSPKLDYAVDFNFFRFQQDWVQNGQSFSVDEDSFDAKLNTTYRFTDKRSLLVTLQYQGENTQTNTTRSGQVSSSLKYVQNFDKNISLTIEGIDLLSSDTQTNEFVSPSLNSTSVADQERRGVRLTLSRRF